VKTINDSMTVAAVVYLQLLLIIHSLEFLSSAAHNVV
jgi:hypothetical protein